MAAELFDMTKYLQENMLLSGTYVINGAQGAGKTSLMKALAITDWRYHGAERKALAQQHIDELNKLDSSYNLTCPAHLYWDRSLCVLNAKPYFMSWQVDISQIGLPDGKLPTQYFPKYSFVVQDEYESLLDNREFKQNAALKRNIFDRAKYARHNQMTIIFAGQVLDRGDMNIRKLATDVFYIYEQKHIYALESLESYKMRLKRHDYMQKKGFAKNVAKPVRQNKVIATEWTFSWIKSQMRNQAEEMKSFDIKIDTDSFYKLCKFRFDGDIRRHYNSFEGEAYHLYGIDDYYVKEPTSNMLDRNSVNNFNIRTPRKYEIVVDAQKEEAKQ